jgi:hypothetical protein
MVSSTTIDSLMVLHGKDERVLPSKVSVSLKFEQAVDVF